MGQVLDAEISAFEKMALHTKGRCGVVCHGGGKYRCCSKIYCEVAEKYALETHGIKLERTDNEEVPFMGPEGCVVPPHLRPICTLHDCTIAAVGRDKNAPFWTDMYFRLRAECEKYVRLNFEKREEK